MNKAKVIIALLICATAVSCGSLRKKDKCPTVGMVNHGMSIKK